MFSKKERASFELAEAMTNTPAVISDDIFAELKVHFRDDQIVELVATVAMENYRGRFNRAFLIEAQGIYKAEP